MQPMRFSALGQCRRHTDPCRDGAVLVPSVCANIQAIFTKHQSRQRTLLSADLRAVLAAAAPSMSCSETEFLACMLDPAGVGTLTLPSLLAGLADSLALMNSTGE